MANKLYKEYTLVPRAEFDPRKEAWFVHVTIVWQVDSKVSFHTLHSPISFRTEKEAVAEGFRSAELWVDQR